MLSDHDRETFDEIEHRLVIEDPQFTRSFDTKSGNLAISRSGVRRTALTVLIGISLIMTVLMIVVHAAGPALLFIAATCYSIWRRRGHHTHEGAPGS